MTAHLSTIPEHVEDEHMRDVERLDTPPQSRFNWITRMACLLFAITSAPRSRTGRQQQWCTPIQELDLLDVPHQRPVRRTTTAQAYRRPDDRQLTSPNTLHDLPESPPPIDDVTVADVRRREHA